MLVDCDIHVGYETLADLIPYLDAPTAELVRQSGTNGLAMPSYPWNHPSGWIRRDLYERGEGHDASFVYMSLETLRARHLDPYGIDLGILEPDEAAVFSVLPNSRLADRLCTAYNDWLLDNWLLREPRLRGMIVVPAQWPEAAAREIRRLGGRDEFVGVFLPGAARVPYGNPMYDPIWEAVDELGLPVAVHTHYESIGIAGPITAAGMPDFYAEYHTLCGSGMYGHFVSILCHGIFERFPETRVSRWSRAGSFRSWASSGAWTRTGRGAAPRSRGAAAGRPSTSGTTSASPPSRSRRPTTPSSCCGRSSSCVPRRR